MSANGASALNPENFPEKQTMIMKTALGGNFGAKFTFTVGSTYLGFALVGVMKGLLFSKRPPFKLPTTRLLASYYLNKISQTSIQYGNGASAAAMLYCLLGWGTTKLFEDELSSFSPFQTNLMIGFLAGGLYKSTLGSTPMIIGAASGLAIAGGINIVIDELRERDYISFEMRFD